MFHSLSLSLFLSLYLPVPLDAPTEIDVKLLNATTVSVKWEPVSRESVRGHLRGYVVRLNEADSELDKYFDV